MSLLALRKAVADELKAKLPRLGGQAVAVTEHAGRFDYEELQRVATRAPAVLVAALGASGLELTSNEVAGACQVAAVIVCKDLARLPRDVAALALVQALAGIVPGNCWGGAADKAPEDIRADNLFSAQIDKSGVAMWGVGWRQRAVVATVGVAEDDESLGRYLVCDVKTELADGAPVAEDEIHLPQQGGN